MQRLTVTFKQLNNSIYSHNIDFELLQNLKQTVSSFHLTKDDFLQFVKLMTEVYELSNNEKLYQIKRTFISISEMAVELKIMVCKMMSLIIVYFEKQESTNSIPFEILSEAVEIMVICSRVCLNEGSNKYISLIQEFYKFIHSPFDLVSATLKKDVRFLHQINVLELMRYRCENQSFTIVEFKKRLSQVVSSEQYNLQQYKNFIQNIVMEIVLKSIKNGKLKSDGIKHFYPYLSEKSQKDLNCLIFDPQSSIKNVQTGSQFLQIYKQIKEKGIQSINIQFLEDFIKIEKNFNDDRVFQIAVLTLEPIILQIWFTVFNIRKQKSPILQKAFMCFMQIIDLTMHQNTYPSKQTLEGILRLSNSVAFAMMTEKKSSFNNQPVLHIIKNFVKILTFLCFSLHQPWDQIKDFGQRTVLLCSRYQSMEIAKVIYAVMLYYCLVKKIKCEELYEKFVAHHNTQKLSQIYKTLSCAYEVQNSGDQGVGDLIVDQSLKLQMRKQPFVAILFAKKNQDMTILQIQLSEFKELKQKFYIYSEILKKYRNDERNIIKILIQMEDFFIKTSIREFQSYMQLSEQENIAVQELFLILIEILQQSEPMNGFLQKEKENTQKKDVQHLLDFLDEPKIIKRVSQDYTLVLCQISFILINLYIMGNQIIFRELNQTDFGILLNKYSAKVKLINRVTEMIKNESIRLEQDIYNICCSYLITVLEKFKKFTIKKERIAQAGEISFVHSISYLVETFHQAYGTKNINKDTEIDSIPVSSKKIQSQSPETLNMKRNFINFTIFQIDCITGNFQKYLKLVDKLPIQILKAFSHSLYAPKNLKQKIFRKIMRQNFTQTKCDISLKEFKQIIEVTDDPDEIQLYIQFVFSTFGQDGRKMVMLMGNQNKKIQKILLKGNDVEI